MDFNLNLVKMQNIFRDNFFIVESVKVFFLNLHVMINCTFQTRKFELSL